MPDEQPPYSVELRRAVELTLQRVRGGGTADEWTADAAAAVLREHHDTIAGRALLDAATVLQREGQHDAAELLLRRAASLQHRDVRRARAAEQS